MAATPSNGGSAGLQKVPGFWTRQTELPATVAQVGFDVLLGILAPPLCLFFDPAVFSGELSRNSLLYQLRLFAYVEIGVGIAALGFYLLTRRPSSFLAGVLYGSAFFAVRLGIAILPLTLAGLFVFIGVFGLTPFVTGFVLYRNAGRCWRQSAAGRPRRSALILAVLAAVLTLGLPLGLNLEAVSMANRAMVAVQSGSDQDFTRAMQTLKWVGFAADSNRISRAYRNTQDAKQRERLSRAFHLITGEQLEDRLALD